MKLLILVFTSLLSFSVLSCGGSKAYKVKMDVLVDGKVLASPELIIKDGKKALFTESDKKKQMMTEIEVVATEKEIQGKKGIYLDFDVSHMVGKNRTIKSSPKLLVAEGKEASIETSNTDGTDKFELKVIATKVNI